jgi:hypothetical protein
MTAKAARGERAQPERRETQLLADLDAEHRNPARVLLGVLVLVGEPKHERADAGAEECLAGRDEVGGGQPARKRARLVRAVEVVRNRGADEPDAQDLVRVAEPPAELEVLVDEGTGERGREERDPEHDGGVARPPGEQIGVERTEGEEREDREPAEEQREGRGAAGLRDARDDGLEGQSDHAEPDDHDEDGGLNPKQWRDAAGSTEGRELRERKDRRAGGQRRRAGERRDAAVVDDHTGRREAVDEQERRHGGERGTDEHRSAVTPARSDDRQRERGARGDRGCGADAGEVEPRSEVDVLRAEGEERDRRNGRADRTDR